MGIGTKIKEYRAANGLTQKDLAEKLHVTFQAVSRWENEDVEPSLETIKAMTEIFGCTVDDLLGIERKQDAAPEPPPPPEPQIIEKIVVQESKPVLAICQQCNSPIYNKDDINRVTESIAHHHGPSTSYSSVDYIYCPECKKKYDERKLAEAKKRAEEMKATAKKRRIKSYVWGGIAFALLLALSIYYFVTNANEAAIFFLVCSFTTFTFIGCLFFNNNFIADMWLTIASWGFVKLPGVIMEFSIGGLIIGFIIKIILWIFGFILAIASVIFATALSEIMSLFVYPFGIAKSLKHPEKTTD